MVMNKISRRWLLGLLLAAWPLWLARPALAVDWRDQLTAGGTAQIIAVIDGDTVQLADGRQVRLIGIQAPKLPLGRPDFTPWPLADAAQAALAALARSQAVTLWYGETRQDRHGRVLAHLARAADGLWLQQAMLRQGMARVYSFADNRALVPTLLAAETQARAQRRGIWREPFYQVRTPNMLEADPDRFAGSFQIVRGRVLDTGAARTRLYVNFGGRWRTDFTVEVPAAVQRRFAGDSRLSPSRLAGAWVEVRGWIERRNGPMIEISHPEQIVFLEIATSEGHDEDAISPESRGGSMP
ncbi:MAG: thermonuclease family protein [Sphingomonadales bacterium]